MRMRRGARLQSHFPGGVVAAHRSLLIGGNIKHPDKRIVKLNIAGAVRRAVADHQLPS
jgi:hypothetical protein